MVLLAAAAPAKYMFLLDVVAKLPKVAAALLRKAVITPVVPGVDVLITILFCTSNLAVVAVALAAWKIPAVPKAAPEEDAFK